MIPVMPTFPPPMLCAAAMAVVELMTDAEVPVADGLFAFVVLAVDLLVPDPAEL